MTFLLIMRNSVFVGLNLTSHVLPILYFFSRSAFKVSAAVLGLSTTRKRLVSSAKSLMLGPISLKMSFIYSRNKRGPRIDPCGTPACMLFQSDCVPGRITLCLLSER